MNSLAIAAGSAALYVAAYHSYGRFLARRILRLDPARTVPAVQFEDGCDYVPTQRYVLFGHHFASIAGLGPILGPAIAVIWGWLPALLWAVFGSILVGAVHDLGALVVSLRSRGRSVGEVAGDLMGPRARALFLLISFFALSLAMGVFVLVVAQVLAPAGAASLAQGAGAGSATATGVEDQAFRASYPEAVIPSVGLVVVALLMGLAQVRGKLKLLPATVLGLAAMTGLLFWGMAYPAAPFAGPGGWKAALLAYAWAASVLPVWLLLQPRDYLNAFQLVAGMALIYLGLALGAPAVVAPAVNPAAFASGTDIPGMFPLLFITVACGAASGFHNLVASGTTARQLRSEGDALFVGYGAMLLEGALAVAVILACTAGFDTPAAWSAHYESWHKIGQGALGVKLSAFVHGAAGFMSHAGVPVAFGRVLVAVVVVGFALTTLDSATRLLRYNVEELARGWGLRALENRHAAALVAVAAIGFFLYMPVGGKSLGLTLWTLFGTTNQLLVGLGLLVSSLYLASLGRPTLYTVAPMLFMLAVTGWAMVSQLAAILGAPVVNLPLAVVSLAVLVLAVWLCAEGVFAWGRLRAAAVREGGRA